MAMRILAFSGLAILALATSAQAQMRMQAENWAKPYSGSASAIPQCQAPEVLAKIQARFAETESEYWSSKLSIVSFEKVRPVAFRPWGLDFIPRQFCTGMVTTSDGHKRNVEFSIIEDGGVIGWSWGVQWCVAGLDRQLTYAPGCKQARP